MKTYSPASSDAMSCLERMKADFHEDLDNVTVSALFAFDLEATEPVLKHQGYPAQAVCRITPTRDRVLGVADAVIVIDRSNWLTLTQEQRDALLDHELTHLERVVDEETGTPKVDVVERPKLAIRRHDRQLGWFDSVAARHGEASPEIRQARYLIESSGQLYFDFHGKQSAFDLRKPNTGAGKDELQTFETRPDGVIDGRSERVKHQDAQREAAEVA